MRASPAALVAAFVTLSLVTRALLLVAPPLSDEPVHLVGTSVLQHGGRLYLDFVDNKPPLLYAYYAVAQLAFGAGLAAVRWLTVLLWIPLTALAASAYYGHRPAGVVAGALYVIAGASFVIDEGLAVNTEVLMLLPAALAFVSVARSGERPWWRAFAAGAWLGVAALFKVTAVLWLPAIPLMAWRVADREAKLWATVRGAVAALAGLSLPLVAVAMVFQAQGTLGEWFEWSVLRNFGYVTARVEAAEALKRAATGAIGWTVATWPLWWAAWRPSQRPGEDDGRWLARVLALLAIPAVVMGYRFFAHYYLQVLLPLCLAAAPAVATWVEGPTNRLARASLAWVAIALAAFTALNAWILFGRNDVLEGRRAVYADVASWMGADKCAEPRTLFVWGREPMFYVASGLRPASRFVLPQETLSGYVPGRESTSAAGRVAEDTGFDWDTLMADLERSRASYVIDTAPSGLHGWGVYKLWNYPRLFLYLREHYDQAAVIDRVVVYRRKDCR